MTPRAFHVSASAGSDGDTNTHNDTHSRSKRRNRGELAIAELTAELASDQLGG